MIEKQNKPPKYNTGIKSFGETSQKIRHLLLEYWPGSPPKKTGSNKQK